MCVEGCCWLRFIRFEQTEKAITPPRLLVCRLHCLVVMVILAPRYLISARCWDERWGEKDGEEGEGRLPEREEEDEKKVGVREN